MNQVLISPVLWNILIGCVCLVVLMWVVAGLQVIINDFQYEKRERKKAAQEEEYHRKRMKELDK